MHCNVTERYCNMTDEEYVTFCKEIENVVVGICNKYQKIDEHLINSVYQAVRKCFVKSGANDANYLLLAGLQAGEIVGYSKLLRKLSASELDRLNKLEFSN